MAKLFNLSTILIQPLPNDPHIKNKDTHEGVTLPKTRLPSLNWVRRLWDRLCLFYAYWNFLADIPLDLFCKAVSAALLSDAESVGSTTEQLDEVKDNISHHMGKIALHPRLPVLAISTPSSSEAYLYNTSSSEEIFRIKIPLDQKITKSVITCLQFSSGDLLAVGFSDGTVRTAQHNLGTTIKSGRGSHTAYQQPEVKLVKFLPSHSSDINEKFLGSVTNIVFSPASSNQININPWLAVATEKSGVWIWNLRTKQALRAVCTGGINEGCLHWVRLNKNLNPEPPLPGPPSEPAPAEESRLGESTIQRWGDVFGNAQDLLKLDEYYAPSSPTNNFPPIAPKLPHPLPGDVSGEKEFDGQSVLVVGTKSGKIRVQKIWHSSIMIQMEKFVEFTPHTLVKAPGKFPSKPSTNDREISHLVIYPTSLTQEAVTVPLLVAFTGEASSCLHAFDVNLAFHIYAAPLSRRTYDYGKALFRQFLNFTFIVTQTDHEWLPDTSAPTINDSVPAVTYSGVHLVRLSPSSSAPTASLMTISAHHSTPTSVFLATLKSKNSRPIGHTQSSFCVLLSPGDPAAHSSTMTPFTSIIPLIPDPFLPSPLPTPVKPSPRGYYARMTAVPNIPNGHINVPDISAQSLVEHDYTCGQAQWGMSRAGRLQGAFLYKPASLVDPGVGVTLFEVEVDER